MCLMMKIEVKIKKLHTDAKVPIYGTINSAAFDLYAVEDIVLEPGVTTLVPTGIALEIPEGYCGQFRDRSGLAIKGIHHLGGLIDSDYRGEFKAILLNNHKIPYKIEKGDRIIQVLISPVIQSEFKEVEELSETQRGAGGFHSTGKK